MKKYDCDIAVIGAGIVGIATAYYIKQIKPSASVVLLDSHQPMSLTSAQSGENYRNWWPHPVMTAFTDRSIDLMEELAQDTGSVINMNRRGYALATRLSNVDALMAELIHGYSELTNNSIRMHDGVANTSYSKPDKPDWLDAPSGVDVLKNQTLIQQTFPSYDKDIKTVVHIRRAGAISAQQLGQLMLDRFKFAGGVQVQALVSQIEKSDRFVVSSENNAVTVRSEQLVNAAGPFINHIANMLGTELPVTNTLQQKIAFEDTAGAIPRQMPFTIDLDAQHIDWTDEEKQLLIEGGEYEWLTREMPGAIHCRPDGGDSGSWLKLGWAFNSNDATASRQPALLNAFPEIVLRGAARLNPTLKKYYGRLPRSVHHYGGYYTLTDENWPLIGAMKPKGSFVVGALSGFGTMAACAAGDLCARLVNGASVPAYAKALSLQRYESDELMSEIRALSSRGIL